MVLQVFMWDKQSPTDTHLFKKYMKMMKMIAYSALLQPVNLNLM